MTHGPTTAAVQRYLDALDGAAPAEPILRALLDRAVRRLDALCAALLHKSYPRLARPPLNLGSDELLGAVVERLIKALREVRPQTVRQFFALASRHMRWELNEVARRLDSEPTAVELHSNAALAPEAAPAASESNDAGVTPRYGRILGAIEALSDDEREVFSLVKIQGLTHAEAAGVVGVSTKTIQRRLNQSLLQLSDALGDLRRGGAPEAAQ